MVIARSSSDYKKALVFAYFECVILMASATWGLHESMYRLHASINAHHSMWPTLCWLGWHIAAGDLMQQENRKIMRWSGTGALHIHTVRGIYVATICRWCHHTYTHAGQWSCYHLFSLLLCLDPLWLAEQQSATYTQHGGLMQLGWGQGSDTQCPWARVWGEEDQEEEGSYLTIH